MPWIKKGINKLIPSVIWQPFPPIKETLKLLPKDAVKIDVGAGGRRITPDTITVDFIKFENTDIVSDIHDLKLEDNSVDCIFCTGTFEHIHSPEVALKEFHRVLKKDGIIHIEVPFMQPYHSDPEDYYRWTESGLTLFCEKYGFERTKSGVHLGPVSAMNVIIIQFFQSFFDNKYLRKLIEIILSYLLFSFKFLDYFLIKKKKAHYLASGVYFIGRKK